MRASVSLLVVLVFQLAPAPLRAQAPNAEALLQEGILRYKLGQLPRSVGLLKRASRVAKVPSVQARTSLYLGLCYSVLGRSDEAETLFKLALTIDPALGLDPKETKKDIIDIFDRARRALRGELKVTADRSGARVAVDGVDVAPHPTRGSSSSAGTSCWCGRTTDSGTTARRSSFTPDGHTSSRPGSSPARPSSR